MMRRWILLSLLISAGIHAAEDRLEDYAYGVPIETDTAAPIYEFTVPIHVYQTAKRADLGDLRIFNAQASIAPHALRQAPAILDTTTRQVPLFPLYRDKHPSDGDLHIRVDAGGAIVEVTGDSGVDATQSVSAYILDTSRESRGIEQLQLQWTGAPASFLTSVQVEASNDLDNWQTIVNSATLARLQHGAYTVAEDRIELGGDPAKYLRISWPAGEQDVVLTNVTVHYAARQRERELQWLTLSGARDEKEPAVFEFDAGGALPAQRLSVELPERNDIQQATIQSRATPEDPWRLRYSGIVYSLKINARAPAQSAHIAWTKPRSLLASHARRTWSCGTPVEACLAAAQDGVLSPRRSTFHLGLRSIRRRACGPLTGCLAAVTSRSKPSSLPPRAPAPPDRCAARTR